MQQFSSICSLQHANVTILYNPIIKSQRCSPLLHRRFEYLVMYVCFFFKKNKSCLPFKSYLQEPAFNTDRAVVFNISIKNISLYFLS